MYELIGLAKLNELDPEPYLHTVLTRFPDHPVSQVRDVCPGTWPPPSNPTLPKPSKTHSSGVHQKTSGNWLTHSTPRQEGLRVRLPRRCA
jgi:hypothetical protein